MSTVALYTTARYLSCPSRAVKFDVSILDQGIWRLHNTCYANSADGDAPGVGVCTLKTPLAEGTPVGNVRARFWNITPDCAHYADDPDINQLDKYTDRLGQGTAAADASYSAQSRLITVDGSTYRLKLDRNGGTTFEFYSKRATDTELQPGNYITAVHASGGAAHQVAIHSGDLNSLTATPCVGRQGYWNPTQSGAACSYANGANGASNSPTPANSQLRIVCDGILNNACTQAAQAVTITEHQMMNWDYGPGYEGPYNAADTSQIAQTINAQEPAFVEYHVNLRNMGATRLAVAAEIPTFYFTNQFRTFYHPNASSGIDSQTIAANNTNDASNFSKTIESHDLGWITFENTLGGVSNYYVTIAWFYPPNFLADKTSSKSAISESPVYDTIKFHNAPYFNYLSTKLYKLKYVIFPYKYDEVINSRYGQQTVLETIQDMQTEFQAMDDQQRGSTFYLSVLPEASGSAYDMLLAQFNEGYYLTTYPDVAQAIQEGWMPSAFYHYFTAGGQQGRNPNEWFNELSYRSFNPDVVPGIGPTYAAGFEHYLRHGAREGRRVISGFDERRYLLYYFDVYQAVLYNPAAFFSGLKHWVVYGQIQGRIGEP